ncbi:MAG TPA: hypothetical protein VN784_07125 [Candidatus Limnocylindrales bacterium]|nr:hypothetical protein [Candidatus Limnocylindrales bacterium]
MWPRIDARLLGQAPQALREEIDIPLWRDWAIFTLVKNKPFEEVVRDVDKAPLARFCLRAF